MIYEVLCIRQLRVRVSRSHNLRKYTRSSSPALQVGTYVRRGLLVDLCTDRTSLFSASSSFSFPVSPGQTEITRNLQHCCSSVDSILESVPGMCFFFVCVACMCVSNASCHVAHFLFYGLFLSESVFSMISKVWK